MKIIYSLSLILGIQLFSACAENNEKISDPEQVSTTKSDQETKPNSGVMTIDPEKLRDASVALVYDSKYQIWQEHKIRNSLSAEQCLKKNNLDGVIFLFVEKFYGPGDANVPIILYVAGDFKSVKIGGVQQTLSQGENFISVPWTFQRGYNRIPVTGITSNDSFNCGIEITFE